MVACALRPLGGSRLAGSFGYRGVLAEAIFRRSLVSGTEQTRCSARALHVTAATRPRSEFLMDRTTLLGHLAKAVRDVEEGGAADF